MGIEAKQILVKIADAGVSASFDGAFRGKVFADEQFQQGGFSGAVIANQANALIGLDMPGRVFYDHSGAEFESNVLKSCYHEFL
jgi:hypothetical protein